MRFLHRSVPTFYSLSCSTSVLGDHEACHSPKFRQFTTGGGVAYLRMVCETLLLDVPCFASQSQSWTTSHCCTQAAMPAPLAACSAGRRATIACGVSTISARSSCGQRCTGGGRIGIRSLSQRGLTLMAISPCCGGGGRQTGRNEERRLRFAIMARGTPRVDLCSVCVARCGCSNSDGSDATIICRIAMLFCCAGIWHFARPSNFEVSMFPRRPAIDKIPGWDPAFR